MEAMRDPLWIQSRLKQYEPRVFYFDFIECVRKVSLVGLAVFYPDPGSYEQLILGIFICFEFHPLKLKTLPLWSAAVLDKVMSTVQPAKVHSNHSFSLAHCGI